MPNTATTQDFENLRNDLHRHQDQDREDFSDMRSDIQRIEGAIAEWTGAFMLAKWALGLGIPAILGVLIAHVVKHWQ